MNGYIIADDYQVRVTTIERKPCAAIIDAEQYNRSLHNALIDAEKEIEISRSEK